MPFLKAMADTNRLRILNLLAGGELCVCDLESTLGLRQANLSRHLAKLRDSGLVGSRRHGSFVYYRLLEFPPEVQSAIHAIIDAARCSDPCKADLQRLSSTCRTNTCC